MNKLIFEVFVLTMLFSNNIFAQSVEEMNKVELREYIYNLEQKYANLKAQTNAQSLTIGDLTKKKDEAVKNEKETSALLNARILELNDSIKILNERIDYYNNNSLYESDNNDFLNSYFFNQVPLLNNSFSLVLSKVIYGNNSEYISENNSRYRSYEDGNGAVGNIPEILDVSSFNFFGVQYRISHGHMTKLDELIFPSNAEIFNNNLPSFEVLKNKLLTLKYPDGNEESFLFNVRFTDNNDKNNQRNILQFEFADEEVKEDGDNSTSKDIIWRFFSIDNQIYLALSKRQLHRIGVNINSISEGVQFNDNGALVNISWNSSRYLSESASLSGNNIFISRVSDPYIDVANYIDPGELIFLFKFKEL